MSDVILFGRTQSALQTPFASDPDRINGYTSKDVQSAIEETLALAISNDRFVVLPSYKGNANVGRYLEIWPGIDSLTGPLSVGVAAKCLRLVLRARASGTATLGFYDVQTGTPSLLYTQTITAAIEKIDVGTAVAPLFTVPATGKLAMKIDSGSLNKPTLLIALSSSL